MTITAADSDIARMRLVAQRLVGEPCESPTEAVRWMTCVQSQDFRAGRAAVALRSGGRSVDAVDAALNGGSVVRSWPMRGTLHLVPAQDIGWMLRLTAAATLRSAAGRHRALDIGPTEVALVEQLTWTALAGGGRMDRRGLFTLWETHGVATTGQRGIHLLQCLAMRGTVCLGPVSAGGQDWVLSDEWIRAPRQLSREASVVEWAARYFRSHGPATRKDLLWWTKLLVRDLDPVWTTVQAQLVELKTKDAVFYADPATADAYERLRRRALQPVLTPAFDEILLGYADRSATLASAHADAVTPGGNGMFRAVVIDGGRAVGTWSRDRRTGEVAVQVFEQPVSARLARSLGRLGRDYPR